jgi:hypothetical protein
MSFADQWGDIFEECNTDSFVDNTLNGCNDAHLEMAMLLPELIAKGQECVQIWEHILCSSSGTLNLKKCFWDLVYWQWIDGHLQMALIIICPGMIALTGSSLPNYTVISRHEVWVAKQTLGVWPAPDGNYQK